MKMITEPFTMITDYILAGFIFYFQHLMREFEWEDIKFWRVGFILVAVAAFTGGTYHGFSLILPQGLLNFLWLATLETVLIANFIFLYGVAKWSFQESSIFYNGLIMFGIIKFMVLEFFIIISLEFLYVAIDYGITFVMILLIRGIIWDYFDKKSDEMVELLKGLILAMIVAFIWFRQISLTAWFNHNDIAHLIQVGVMYFIYQGVTSRPLEIDESGHRFLKR